MFNWKKNKKKDQSSDFNNQARIKKSEDVTFHTMQNDLNIPKSEVAEDKLIKGKLTTKEKKVKSEINYDKTKNNTSLNSPFLSDSSAKSKSFTIPPKTTHKTIQNESKRKPSVNITTETEHIDLKINRGTILKIFTSLLAITAILTGMYFFWAVKNPIELPYNSTLPETQNPTEEVIPEEIPLEKYSLENPNYLSIDTESVSSEDISQLLIQTANELKESKNNGPFEFVVTDSNNNPLSFSIFAYLSKMNISRNTLNGFDENFSLYFYRDNGNMRTGLAIDIANKEIIDLEFTKEKDSLSEKLQPLFLGCSFQKTDKSFNIGSYKTFSISYLNLDEENNLSIDYTITENQLIIGLSKDTARAIIDKMEIKHSENLTIITNDDEDEEDEEDVENEDTADGDVDIEL